MFDLNLPSSCLVVAGSITDWDSKVHSLSNPSSLPPASSRSPLTPSLPLSLSLPYESSTTNTNTTTTRRYWNDAPEQTIIGQKARGPTVTKDGAALNAARRSGAAIETDKKGAAS